MLANDKYVSSIVRSVSDEEEGINIMAYKPALSNRIWKIKEREINYWKFGKVLPKVFFKQDLSRKELFQSKRSSLLKLGLQSTEHFEKHNKTSNVL